MLKFFASEWCQIKGRQTKWPGLKFRCQEKYRRFVSSTIRLSGPPLEELHAEGKIVVCASTRFEADWVQKGTLMLHKKYAIPSTGGRGAGGKQARELENVEFWHLRNSWGTEWGENGFMRIRMYRNNLGVETHCSWAELDLDL